MRELRDLIYFDFEKAASLFSQLEGGLLERTEASSERAKDERNIRNYNLGVFSPQFGGQSAEKRSQMEVRVLHHDLLVRLEELLVTSNLAVKLDDATRDRDPDVAQLREFVSEAPYVRATGWTIVEDYERMNAIGARMNDLNAFIGRCNMASLEKSPEYLALEEQLDSAKARAAAEQDRNKRSRLESQVAQKERKLREKIAELTGLGGIDEWLTDGIKMFVNLFMKDRILLRLYPAPHAPRFQILSHLKRHCFVDGDLDAFVATYGNRPTVRLTVLGLVTSVPPEAGPAFDATAEYRDPEGDHEAFEAGFRRIFDSFEAFYDFIRYSRYPNVTVSPVAVYRRITGSEEATA